MNCNLDVAHVLLGEGIRLYETGTAQLKRIRIVEAPDVTRVQFRVVKRTRKEMQLCPR